MKYRFFNSQKAFSIIEILLAVSIMGVIGFFTVTLLSRSFQGNNKVEVIGNIKQNGEIALHTLETTLRDSLSVTCTGDSNRILVVQTKEGTYKRLRIVPQSTLTNTNGFISQREFIDITDPSKVPTEMCLTNSTVFPIVAAQETQLTDNNNSSGVSILSGSFVVRSRTGYKENIEVNFNMGPSRTSGTGIDQSYGGAAGVAFRTTIQLR